MTYPWAAAEVLTAADLNAYAGLVYITSATATSGTALSVNNCFSAQYDTYRIVISNVTIGAASGMKMRMRVSGTDNSSANYYHVRHQVDYTGAVSSDVGSAVTDWNIPVISDTDRAGMTMDIYNAFAAAPTTFSAHGSDSRNAGYGFLAGGGKHNVSTSYTGFTVFSTQTITNMVIRVYGYNNG